MMIFDQTSISTSILFPAFPLYSFGAGSPPNCTPREEATVHIHIARPIEIQQLNTIQLIYNQAISAMLRLICQNPFFAFAVQSANISKYTIKNNAYLIEAPPKRPVNGYMLFVTDKTKGVKGTLMDKADSLSKEWKQFKEIQDKYNQISKEKNAGYAEKKKQYQEKYVEPFKTTGKGALRLKKLFDDGIIKPKEGEGIKNLGQQVKAELAKPRSLEDEKKLEEEAAAIKAKREAKKKAFLFPSMPSRTYRSYLVRHGLPKEQRGPTYDADMKAGFAAEKEQWKIAMKKWLEDNKYDITVEDFQALLKKEEKRKKREANAKAKEDETEDY